MIFIFLKE